MKKALLTIAITVLSTCLMAQTSPKSAPNQKDKEIYKRFIKISESDYNSLIILSEAYVSSLIYDPRIADKIKERQNVNNYLFDLPKRVALDSVKVKP